MLQGYNTTSLVKISFFVFTTHIFVSSLFHISDMEQLVFCACIVHSLKFQLSFNVSFVPFFYTTLKEENISFASLMIVSSPNSLHIKSLMLLWQDLIALVLVLSTKEISKLLFKFS